MIGAPGAHSYSINVAENGRFLFRTEENNASNRNQVLEAITKAFPASEGYEVSIVDWPARSGAYTVIHKPEPGVKPRLSIENNTFEEFKRAYEFIITSDKYTTERRRSEAITVLIQDSFPHLEKECRAFIRDCKKRLHGGMPSDDPKETS